MMAELDVGWVEAGERLVQMGTQEVLKRNFPRRPKLSWVQFPKALLSDRFARHGACRPKLCSMEILTMVSSLGL